MRRTHVHEQIMHHVWKNPSGGANAMHLGASLSLRRVCWSACGGSFQFFLFNFEMNTNMIEFNEPNLCLIKPGWM